MTKVVHRAVCESCNTTHKLAFCSPLWWKAERTVKKGRSGVVIHITGNQCGCRPDNTQTRQTKQRISA